MAIMGLMAVAAEINAQETTDNAEKKAKETVNKKQPNYPMKEVSGTIYDAATGKPLSGVQIQALGNARYAAMTNEDGTFTIKVPTFTTSLYLFTSQYASQQVSIAGVNNIQAKMLSDKFNEMYTNGTKLGNEASLKAQVVHRLP